MHHTCIRQSTDMLSAHKIHTVHVILNLSQQKYTDILIKYSLGSSMGWKLESKPFVVSWIEATAYPES